MLPDHITTIGNDKLAVKFLNRLLEQFTPRVRKLVAMRLAGATRVETAKEFGITELRVQQIEKTALAGLGNAYVEHRINLAKKALQELSEYNSPPSA